MKKFMFMLVLGLFLSSSVVVLADEVVVEETTVVEETVVEEVVVEEEVTPDPIVCEDPQVLNEAGDACVDPTPVVEKKKRSSGSYLPAVWAEMQAKQLTDAQPTVYVWDVVKFGDKGEDVKTLQMYLNNKGAKLVVDGIYGPLTLAAFGSFK